jgi:monoamine oxidase
MSRHLLNELRARHAPAQVRVDRRRALQLLALAAATPLVQNCRVGGLPKDAPDLGGKRVAVIGAGLAGLLCASQLRWAGYDVMLFEARQRLGGRVQTLTDFVPGRTVEAGGERIGANHATFLGLCSLHKIELADAVGSALGERPIVLGGRRLSSTESAHLHEELEAALAALNELAAQIDAERPWTSARAAEHDARSLAAWIDELAPSELARAALCALFEARHGVACERASLLAQLAAIRGGGLADYWTQSERFRCKEGNDVLVTRLSRRVGPTRMLLDTPIRTVRRNDTGYELETFGGARYPCADVVLTAPPSTWSRIEFDPPLPLELAPQMGTHVKLLLALDARPWRDSGFNAELLGNGLVQQSWEPLPQAADDLVHALTLQSGGPSAERWRRISEVERRYELARQELELAWPGTSAHVKQQRWLDWSRDPWALASCAFPAPGQLMRIGALLRAGYAGIKFAGEHCSSAFPGSMEGALQTGLRAARELAARDGLGRAS